MAPTKPKAGASKGKSTHKSSKPPKAGGVSKNKSKKAVAPTKQHKPQQHKLKPGKKKQRTYTAEELGIQKLNMITPAGVQKPKGKKKGKVFVDDPASMMTILAMVNADKEGQIESKVMKERQMEEIRQARQKEMEAKQQEKKDKLEQTKKTLRRKKSKPGEVLDVDDEPKPTAQSKSKSGKKRVSFA